jgi:hypothetical protein
MAIDDLDKRFGTIAVEKGFITPDQLIEALTVQVMENLKVKKHKLIGAILREKKFMTIQEIDEVLKELL